jgi:hypothetical protein
MKDRGVRRTLNQKVIQKRLKLLKQNDNTHPDITGKTYYEKMAEEPGRLRKKHPYDCGTPDCLCCHLEKVQGKKKINDKKRELGGIDDEI